ncbi:lipoate--protein ligase [Clostridium tetani]|uniref:lipoate--protein ligase n=1 Tax=Clostridium tetani TaxID=1513 RepID=UPI00100BB65F|nr:lipoate--protein ligase [Clostridium tetani]RXM75046.1 lipoate--protein ligase [Clostridium tetani]RYU98423.1 lipoate--protein ligase [Clostridium tetani]BDR73252.1 lipoate--protein ligase [Clostridium tetani]
MQNKLNLKIIKSDSFSPYHNLALEEFLFNNLKKDEVIFYLWQNENTVVIGKNQNPWKECNVSLFQSEKGLVARRLSGGGAVYHDLGNLNFTFLMSEDLYDLKKQLSVIIDGLNSIGIEAEFSGRNDIVVDGKKISGNAFYFDEGKAYHHGTILVDVNVDKLQRYLNVSSDKIKSKGIDSVRSRVINLKELHKDLTIDKICKAMMKSFSRIYHGQLNNLYISSSNTELIELQNKYSSWEWLFGETPEFEINFEKRFSFGNIDIGFALKDAVIKKVFLYSDMLNTELISKIKNALIDVHFNVEDICKGIDSCAEKEEEKNITKEIVKWLKEEIY